MKMKNLTNKKMQSTTLLNGLQRENAAKDALIHQAKSEIEKLKKGLRGKGFNNLNYDNEG